MNRNSLPVPENEAERLRLIDQMDIMYSEEEAEFQELVQAIADICEVKMAIVTIVHKNVQWFKACVGLDLTEVAREISFCQHTIMQQDIMEVPNMLHDERFVDNPFVTGPAHIRFYAGQPIVVNGLSLGVLCVLDDHPKQLDAGQREALRFFGLRVAELLESRQAKLKAMKQG